MGDSQPHQLWQVVGTSAKGGILVRSGVDLASQELDRLSTGALVQELELIDERLCYRLLDGSGPKTGWVSIRVKAKDMLMKTTGQLWEVVGGSDKGGILARSGAGLDTPELGRLSTGACVREVSIIGERLQYVLVTGAGPASGWVSTKIKGKAVLAQMDSSKEKPPGQLASPDIQSERTKLRVLALHGQGSNSNILKFQMAPLKAALGKQVEWLYLDSRFVWEHDPSHWDQFRQVDRSDMEKQLSKGQPFRLWCTSDDEVYYAKGIIKHKNVQESCDDIMNFIAAEGPIDAMVCFSQGSLMTCLLIDRLRAQGVKVPWSLNVFFSGGNIHDPDDQFTEPSSHPTIRVTAGKSDETSGVDGEESVSSMFTDLLEIEHADGHGMPKSQPRAREIFEQVAAEVWRRLGGKL